MSYRPWLPWHPPGIRSPAWSGAVKAVKLRCSAHSLEPEPLQQARVSRRQPPGTGDARMGAAEAGATIKPATASGEEVVDETAVEALVQHALQQRKRVGTLPPDVIASRVRVLLAAGFSEAQVRKLAAYRGRGLYFSAQGGARTLRLLCEVGLSQAEVVRCVVTHPGLLATPETSEAAVEWLQRKFAGGRQRVGAVIKRAPTLLNYTVQTLEANWDGFKRILKVEEAEASECLYASPNALERSTLSVERSVQTLEHLLGSRGAATSLLRRRTGLLGTGAERLQRNWDSMCVFVAAASLAVQDGASAGCSWEAALDQLHLSRLSRQEEGAPAHPQDGCSSAGQPSATGAVLGPGAPAPAATSPAAAEAVAHAVLECPSLLSQDVCGRKYRRRLAFMGRHFGLQGAGALNAYLAYSLTNVAPRLAWAKLHAPQGDGLPERLRPFTRPDAECMALCGVPVEGFAAFKQEWLTSGEGREWCQHEDVYRG